jgi:hypothetical protein
MLISKQVWSFFVSAKAFLLAMPLLASKFRRFASKRFMG